jgi:DNA-binding transcriptional LysR family regulator
MLNREMLTLIPVFDAILSEGSLSRAADRLGVTQSAVSQALARLRRLANDELFENTGRGVRPTPRALEMAQHVYAALAQVNEAFTPKHLDLAKLERTFILDVGGGFDALVLPPLLPVVQREAPGLRFLVSNTRGGDLTKELKYGETELAFDFQACDADGIRCDLLGRAEAVVLARPDHPALKKGVTEDLYFALPHVSLVWARSMAVSGVALELERMGRSPVIAVSVPTLMGLGAVAASSHLIATASAYVGKVLARHYGLVSHPMPFPFPQLALYQMWHERYDDDSAHKWLRETIRRLAEDAAKAGP